MDSLLFLDIWSPITSVEALNSICDREHCHLNPIEMHTL